MTTVKERPILFSGEMVRAILAGRKTVTRRVVKPQPVLGKPWRGWTIDPEMMDLPVAFCPYGIPGDRLWVRETWAAGIPGCPNGVTYRADHLDPKGDGPANPITWKPSIHMPHWASRITMEITGVRVERVQEITSRDCELEGWQDNGNWGWYHSITFRSDTPCAVMDYAQLWDSINAKRGHPWSSNPWVWVIEFRPLASEEAAE